MSKTVADLVRQALAPKGDVRKVVVGEATGLPVVYVGMPVTTEMVRAALDDE